MLLERPMEVLYTKKVEPYLKMQYLRKSAIAPYRGYYFLKTYIILQ